MREIKFRFYSNVTKKMYTELSLLGLQYRCDNNPAVYCVDRVPSDDGGERVQSYSDGHLMQYTGLKDVSGREIYEGDILRSCDSEEPYFNSYDSDQGIGAVEWLHDSWNISRIENSLHYIVTSYRVEVIGNIYENPELLKEV